MIDPSAGPDLSRRPTASRRGCGRAGTGGSTVWFLLFIVIHVTLVFTTGLLRNLNHIYAGRNDSAWIGFGLFAVTTAIMIVTWVAATPVTLRYNPDHEFFGYRQSI